MFATERGKVSLNGKKGRRRDRDINGRKTLRMREGDQRSSTREDLAENRGFHNCAVEGTKEFNEG